jgi:hypothetical protein
MRAIKPAAVGRCGDEFYIADELWRLAHRVSRAEFEHFVALMIAVSRPKRRGPRVGAHDPEQT